MCALQHLLNAFFLKCDVSDCKHLIHNDDLTPEMCGHRKSQLDIHAAGIALHWRIDKLPDFGKVNDLIKNGVDLLPAHTQDRAVQVYVLSAGHFPVKAGPDFQHRGHAPVEIDLPCRGPRYPGDQFKQGAFPGTVAPNNAKTFPLADREVDVFQRKEGFVGEETLMPNLSVRVRKAFPLCLPGLQIPIQSSAPYLAETVNLAHVSEPDHQIRILARNRRTASRRSMDFAHSSVSCFV